MLTAEGLLKRLKLPMNAEKTRCCRVPEEPMTFFGYRIGRNYRPDTGTACIGTRPSPASVQSMCRRLSELTTRRSGLLPPEVVVARLNRLLTGWANYFTLGQVSPAYAAVDRQATLRRLTRPGRRTDWRFRSMADQLDDRPVFTIVMGCNGAGKSAWKRGNYDLLPERFFDQDSIAGGIGDGNSESARVRTRAIVDAEVAEAVANRLDFGTESTSSGRPGREMVDRVRNAGYRIEGIYIGTVSPEINIERIERRVRNNTGHRVDPARVPERYRYSLSNLRRTAEVFDQLVVIDNSDHDERGIPCPVEQCVLERGAVVNQVGAMVAWCSAWLAAFEQSVADREGSCHRPTTTEPA